MNNRTEYLFSYDQRMEALERAFYQCEYCGEHVKLEAHHILPIWFAREVGIPREVITSIENLAYADHKCHTNLHRKESRYEYAQIAWHLFGIDVEVDSTKDDWRKDPDHPINRR